MKKLSVFAVFVFLTFLSPSSLVAQFDGFGKNKVIWEKNKDNFYQSEHFDVWHSLDLKDQGQKKLLEDTAATLESAYSELSFVYQHEIQKKIPIVIYRTHSEFESTNILAEFLPEGVGAFVESEQKRMVLKGDFSPPLNKSIIVHELAHEFQFSILERGFLGRLTNSMPLPQGFFEGGAEFIASLFVPHTRDDIRRQLQRTDAANPELFYPTWQDLASDRADPYAQWEMVFEFLEEKYKAGVNLQVNGLKSKGSDLGKLIEELTNGEIKNPNEDPEIFDRLHRDYWREKYAKLAIESQSPYKKTDSFEGKNMTPKELPAGILSLAISPDGKEVSVLSPQKNGISLMVFPSKEEKKDEDKKEDSLFPKLQKKSLVRNLTPKFPPKNFEYIISQRGNTWPFNGADIAWSPKERRIAFFARYGKDHELFLADADNKSKFIKIKIPFDQAFSPAFGPDGNKIYFSASRNASRDIYEFDFRTLGFRNLTNDENFDTAPAVSPDGKILVYVAFDGDFQKLFLLDLETLQKTQLTFNRFNDDSPVFWGDKKILYTSDEKNGAWNVCTIDLETKKVEFWTEFFGGAFVPKPVPGSDGEIMFIEFWQYDQFQGRIYKNFELYRAKLLNPLSSYIMENKRENMVYAWRPFRAVEIKLDENQISNPIVSPKRWIMAGRSATVGLSNYWGAFGYGELSVSDVRENHLYNTGFAFSGNVFRLVDFNYLNRENRMSWGYGAYDHKIPLRYLHFNPTKGYPDQPILNFTLGEEYGGMLYYNYPFGKFSRVEFGAGANKRKFDIFIDEEFVKETKDFWSDNDKQFYDFFKKSSGVNAAFSFSYVRDTVLFSQNTEGPIHGNALRVGVELSPPLGIAKTPGYFSGMLDYRRYKRVSSGSLLAFRLAGRENSRPNGDFILMGGDETLRAYPYGSLAGNRVLYGSAEFRFPFIDAIVFPGGIALGPIRGFAFSDYGLARFSNGNFPTQKGASVGFGLNFGGMNFVWAWREIDKFKKRVPDMYVGWNF